MLGVLERQIVHLRNLIPSVPDLDGKGRSLCVRRFEQIQRKTLARVESRRFVDFTLLYREEDDDDDLIDSDDEM